MANLIEQMNILKGLSDEALQSEIHAPSGSAPPYLVMTELGRRKDMRQRYEGELARKKPRTTVLEDMTAGGGMGAGAPPAPAMAPGGAGIGPTPEAMQAPGFASGGIVDYADIAKKYQDKLDGLTGQTDRARALALLAAGAGIMSGGHSNTLQNLGLGINAGVQSYQTAVEGIDKEELDLLRGITDIGQAQSQMDLADRQQAFQERQLAIQQQDADTRAAVDRDPASVRETKAYMNMTPEEQAAYDKLHPAYNPNGVTNDMRLAEATDKIYADAQKKFPIASYDTPEQSATKMQKAAADAYLRIKASYGAIAADEWAAGMGLDTGDIVLGGAPTTPNSPAPGDTSDFLNLGL